MTTDADARRAKLTQWETIQNERYGFMIAYPGSVFAPSGAVPIEDGHVLVSRDGGARLLVGAFDNETAATLIEYREQLLSENYTGADLDYAPIKKRSFVISGTRGDMHFYERVSFTCGGRLINSWALLYPVSERRIYDPIVEAIARTYTPGAGRNGQCN
ncbi:hypothetical protein [Hyphomicrobium sp.]|uniref:hypothetical protein n=1 Tax=Hyphomicrobium sp. TaxID=82 RepID=UPI0025C3C602|nr:hypothetical protein [Hyphomicrobium sp.]MCC7250418.1 hypothetical protein [Hyphomicrobium sp.]